MGPKSFCIPALVLAVLANSQTAAAQTPPGSATAATAPPKTKPKAKTKPKTPGATGTSCDPASDVLPVSLHAGGGGGGGGGGGCVADWAI